MKTVLFICTGNTCRSPMAEAIFNDLADKHPFLHGKVIAKSAGIMAGVASELSEYSSVALKEISVPAPKHQSRQLTKELMDEAALILTMEARHLREIMLSWPEAGKKAHTLKGFASHKDGYYGEAMDLLDIADPFCRPKSIYIQTAKEIRESIVKILSRLEKEIKAESGQL